MSQITDKFNILFKKYRLKAEISTLSEFGNLLAEKGFNYEDSIFSHWQNGTRIPQYRNILIKLLEIFIERGAINSLSEANEFLASANQGYLSKEELKKIPLMENDQVFQVPNEIENFSGREDTLEKILETDILGKVLVIHGPAGVGKTALAIKLGHLLRDKYKDGVLWYKVEEDNIMDILLSISKTLGEDVSSISDLQVRGTVARSLLASKNILLFLDSAELYPDIDLLIPNSNFCTTVITSQKNQIKAPIDIMDIELNAFTNEEALNLFKNVLKEKYSKVSQSSLLKIARKVGNLPLALGLLARELKQSNVAIVQEDLLLQGLYNHEQSLNSAISLSYNKLSSKNKSVLVSASIFKGKDFSTDSIAYINGLSKSATSEILSNLTRLSLIEHSTKNRFRIHPAIKGFVRDRLDYPRSAYLLFIAILILLFFISWWIILQSPIGNNHNSRTLFTAIYFVMALYGGIVGINASLNWGGLKTLLGRATSMFSLGLFMQVFGQLTYSYYTIFKNIQVPYPSLGDIGYFGSICFYIYGVFLLAKSSGIGFNPNSLKKKIITLSIPTFMLGIGYILFLKDYNFDFNNIVKIFLDFGYPLGDAICISIALVLFIFSRNILDGIMRSKALLILIALVVQFVADYTFLYTINTYTPGNFVELIYLVAYFVMTLALLSLKSISIKVY